MPFTLTFAEGDYDEVRHAISADLKANALPNTTIDFSIYKGEAESRINRAIVGLTEQQITDAAAELKRAGIFLTAAFIAPRIRIIVKETLEGDELQWQNHDLTKLAADLIASGSGILNDVVSVATSAPRDGISDVFGLAGASKHQKGDLTERTGSGWGF